MKEMEVVFFDLYGTLIRIHTDEEDLTRVWRPLCYLYGYYGASYTPGTLRAAYRREISRQEAAAQAATGKRLVEIRLEQVFGALFAQKEVASVPPSVLAEVGRMFRACSTDVSKLYPGAGSLLDALRGAGKRVFLLSNAQRLFTEPEMRRLRLWDRFDKNFYLFGSRCQKAGPGLFPSGAASGGGAAPELPDGWQQSRGRYGPCPGTGNPNLFSQYRRCNTAALRFILRRCRLCPPFAGGSGVKTALQ